MKENIINKNGGQKMRDVVDDSYNIPGYPSSGPRGCQVATAQCTPTPRSKCPPISQGRLLSVGIKPQTWPLTPSKQERCH